MCGRYLAYANVPKICHACDISPEDCDNSDHVCNSLSVHDMNEMCVYAMQLYKPEKYGTGSEIISLNEDQLEKKEIGSP